jgi:spore coat protein A
MATEPNELRRRVGMKVTRRQFLKATAATAAVASVGGFLSPRRAHAFVQSPSIPLWGTNLRGVGPGGIPVALPTPGVHAPVTGVTRYRINIRQYRDQITGGFLDPTTLWGYNPTYGLGDRRSIIDACDEDDVTRLIPKHLGGIMIGERGHPIQINFKNLLIGAAGSQHIIPLDTTIPGANQAPNRTAVHFHGGLVPWISDGGPFDWFNFRGLHGSSFLNNKVLNPLAPRYSAEYYYPMNQSARFGWYHDHAVGITRINAYAGLASGLLIRDKFERDLMNLGLPQFIEAGGNELPLIIQEKVFVGPDIATQDPTWLSINLQQVTRNPGSLWYAHVYDRARWEVGPGGLALPDPSAIPEFFGDTMLVNGTTYPQVTVQARRYRLRLLNATNARFLNLQLYVADPTSPNGITLDAAGFPTNAAFNNAAAGGPYWLQIGTEGGFLANPALVPSDKPFDLNGQNPEQVDPSQLIKSLIVAPAERPDVIVDFTGYERESIILYADAPAPFPGGGPETDFFPGLVNGNPVNANTPDGFGPNSRVLMRFNVVPAQGSDSSLGIGTGTDLTGGIDRTLLPTWGWTDHSALPFPTRFLTLNEYFDEYGRLIQILGNQAAPYGSPYFGMATYLDYPVGTNPASVGYTQENVDAGATEVWEIFNRTGDVHPMHFHLVNVQVINRQFFDPAAFPAFKPAGPVIPPDGNELGWKETVAMYPGTVTRVIMKWDLAPIVDMNGNRITTKARPIIGQLPITDGMPPVSPRTGGHEYVWHCHILEHEEHDMMHALVVT